MIALTTYSLKKYYCYLAARSGGKVVYIDIVAGVAFSSITSLKIVVARIDAKCFLKVSTIKWSEVVKNNRRSGPKWAEVV